ncbi:MBL fold hydrolase [Bacteroidia bacterium]|nr:MBL fold hydrolase [Bacteroidia bacterium]
MKITIHRGINQIGGCITEIATANKRILIDLGQNLPDNKGIVEDNLANSPAIEMLTNGIEAIFYTHYHGDHIGLFHYVPDAIPQYIGATAKQVAICKHKQLSRIHGREELSERELSKLEKMRTFVPAQQITDIEGFTITPFFVSHSACDSFMFLIEAEGKRILHTGDFRDHGYLGKGLLPTIEKYIIKEKVDILISEGTMLSRLDERVQHEKELRKKVIEVMKRYKNVFVMCSSTDLERLATFHSAHNHFEKRPFVCDIFQQDVLNIFTETAGTKTDLFNFDKVYSLQYPIHSPNNTKLIDWMKDRGFCMLVRATKKFNQWLDALLPQLDSQETVLIYSMWPEYVNPDNAKHVKDDYLKFVERFPAIEKIHTSGHASAEALTDVCNLVNPTTAIIPIHSEHANHFGKLNITEALKLKIVTESTVIQDIEIKINTIKYKDEGKELAEEYEKKRKDNFKRRMNFFAILKKV